MTKNVSCACTATRAGTPRRQGCALYAPSTGPPALQPPNQHNGRESAPRMGALQLPNGTGRSAPHAQPVRLHECDCDNSSHYFACRHSPPSSARALAHAFHALSPSFLVRPSFSFAQKPERREYGNNLSERIQGRCPGPRGPDYG